MQSNPYRAQSDTEINRKLNASGNLNETVKQRE